MYESFYGLREKPFSLIPDPDFLFLGRLHAAALSMLEYALRGQASFTLISGEVGSGKTILVRRFLRMIGRRNSVGIVTNTPRQSIRLLEHILLAFNLEYRGKSEVEQYETLVTFVAEQRKLGRRCVLIIDEAHNLSEESLEDLRMLSNVNVDKSLALQIILVGQPEIHERLNTRNLRQLVQRISVNFKLLPLTFTETRQYVRHRLQVAGGSPDIFAPKAIALIHLLSGGIPRLVNILCDASLVYGFGESRETLDDDIVLAVVEDISRGGLDTLPGIDQRSITPSLLAAADELVESLKFEEPEDPPVATQEYFEEEPEFDSAADEELSFASRPGHPARRREVPVIRWDEDTDAATEMRIKDRAGPPAFDTAPKTATASLDKRWWLLPVVMFLAILAIAAGALWIYWPIHMKMPNFMASGVEENVPQPILSANVADDPPPPRSAVPKTAPGSSAPKTTSKAPVRENRERISTESVPISSQDEAGPAPVDTAVPTAALQPAEDAAPELPPPKQETPAAETAATESGKTGETVDLPDQVTESEDRLDQLSVLPADIVAPRYASLSEAIAAQPLGSADLNSAAIKLFDLWGRDFQATAGTSLCSKAENSGLSCYQHRGSLESVLQLNRPAIVGLRNLSRPVSYAVVFQRNGNNLSLALGNETVIASVQELDSLVSDSFVLLWQSPPDFNGLLAEGSRGKSVNWLRSKLNKVPGIEVAAREDGVFDAELAAVVRSFQEQRGLQVDGIVGKETVMQLIGAAGSEDEPTLE